MSPFLSHRPLVAQSLGTLSVLLALSANIAYAQAPTPQPQDATQAPAAPSNEQISLDQQLMNAVQDKDAELVRQLLAAGANANMRDKHGEHPLNWAAGAKSTAILKMLLAVPGIDVNAGGCSGDSPLAEAAGWGNADAVRLLLAVPGIDVNKADDSGETPLYHAAGKGHAEVVKLLLAAPGIMVNSASDYDDTPLEVAAMKGRTEVMKLLLAAPGIDMKAADKALIKAAAFGQTEVVKLLLATPGVDVKKACESQGWTELQFGASAGLTEMVATCIANGADVNAMYKSRFTPLYIATKNGHIEVVKLLLNAPGINVNAVDSSGTTPIGVAAEKGHTEILKLLLAAPGINVNTADKNGRTPLYCAISRRKSEVVKLLLATPGVDVNMHDSHGFTPLCSSVKSNDVEHVRLLLAAPGIDVNKPDLSGRTPLDYADNQEIKQLLLAANAKPMPLLTSHPKRLITALSVMGVKYEKSGADLVRAARKGDISLVKLLLMAEVDVNVISPADNTALCAAVRSGNIRMVKFLLSVPGIDVNKSAPSCLSPLGIAVYKNNVEMVKLLLAAPGINVNYLGEDIFYLASLSANAELVKALLAAPGADVAKACQEMGCEKIHLFAASGCAEEVAAELAAGVDPNVENYLGETPLMLAVSKGKTDVVRVLLAAPGIDTDAVCAAVGGNYLHIAAAAGLTDVVDEAIKRGDALNGMTDSDKTLLHLAARHGHTDVVKLLLAAPGVDVNVQDEWDLTPLCLAAEAGHIEVVKLLLAMPGINVNNPTSFANTPIFLAKRGGHQAVVDLLMNTPGVDVDAFKRRQNAMDVLRAFGVFPQDYMERMAVAARTGNLEVVKLLLAAGCNPNYSRFPEYMPLYQAALNGHTEVVRALLATPEIRVINACREAEWTELHLVSAAGLTDKVEDLIRFGGVNEKSKLGETPLHLAAKNGHVEVVKLLLANEKIDVNVVDYIGFTPLSVAATDEIEQLLRAAGATPPQE